MATKIPFGTPTISAALPFTTGQFLFVHSGTGSDGNTGLKPERALATVNKAIGLCNSGKYDVIVVMPGHTETVTATSIVLSVAGVQVVCVGNGLARPKFTFGAAAATITVSAADCSWSGGQFVANFADVAAAFTLSTAKDFKLDGNTFVDTSTILNFLSIVVTGATNNAADGLRVINNWYQGLAATTNAFVSVLGNLDRLTITGNYVDKLSTNDAGQFLTIAAKVILAANIARNVLSVLGAAGAAVGIFLTGSSTTNTGIVADNYVGSLDTTAELIATAGTKLRFFNNYYTGTGDASGKLWPIVDAA